VDGCGGIGDRTEHVVGDRDELRRVARGLTIGGHHHGEHVTEVRGDATLGDHHGPVLVEDAHAQRAGDVGCGEHGLDARHRACGRRVDRQHVRTGVIGELHRGVQQPGEPDVVDVAARPERQFARLVLVPALADAHRQLAHELLALGESIDRVEDLDVPGASAQVRTEEARRIVAFEVGTLLVDERLGPHDDARRAEPALQCAGGREHVGVALRLGGLEPLDGGDGATGRAGER
jgi:hypothetical protein